MSEIRTRLIRGSAYIFFSGVFITFLTVINSIIIARLLGPENLGIFYILRNMNGIAISMCLLGFPVAISKFISQLRIEDKEQMEKVISTGFLLILFFSIIVSIIYFAISDLIANKIYNEPIYGTLIKISSIAVIFSSLMAYGQGNLRGFHEMKTLALIGLFLGGISIPINFFLIFKYNLIGAAVSLVLINVLMLLIMIRYLLNIKERENISFIPKIDSKILFTLLKFSFPVFLSGFVILPSEWLVNSYLGLTKGFRDVGLFRVGYAVYSIVLTIPGAIATPLLPIVSELHSLDQEKLSLTVSKILRIVLIITLPLVIGAGMASKLILFILYGSGYLDGWFVLFLLIMTSFMVSLSPITLNVLQGTGKTWQILGFDIFGALLHPILSSYFLINAYGLTGIGISYFTIALLTRIIVLSYLKKIFNINLSFLKEPIVLWLVFMPISYFIVTSTQNLMTVMYGIIIISILLFLIYKILKKEEKDLIIQNLRLLFKFFTRKED